MLRLLLLTYLVWSQVSAHSLANMEKNMAMEKLLDTLMGEKVKMEDNEDEDHGRYLREATDETDDHEEFHELTGTQHHSEAHDEQLARMEMKKLLNEGQISKADVDLAVALESLDRLMSTTTLTRATRSSGDDEDEGIQSFKEALESVTKAGTKVRTNKVEAAKHLDRAKSYLQTVVKAIDEDTVSNDIDENLMVAMKSEKLLDDLIENIMHKNDKRVRRSLNDPTASMDLKKIASIDDMLNEYYKNTNKLKTPSKPLREKRAAGESGVEKFKQINSNEIKKMKSMYEDPSNEQKLMTKGFSEKQYKWLLEEFNLSKVDLQSVESLSEEEFAVLQESLSNTMTTTAQAPQYSVADLVEVLKSARQLVPAELEAAAVGAAHMGMHLGGRAMVAVDPVVTVLRDQVYPGAKKMVADSMSDEVKNWAGEGGRIASKRVQMVAEYAGPRLVRLGKSMDQLQGQLTATAGDALKDLVPQIVPALRLVVEDLRETIELAREVLPMVAERVGEQTMPVYQKVKDTVGTHVVQPMSNFMSDSAMPAYQAVSNTIAEPVGKYVDVVAPLGKAVANKVADGGRVLATSSGEVLRDQVMPAVTVIGRGARHQAGQLGDTIKTSVVPTVRDVLKSTLNTLFTGVPKVIQKMSHEAHDAAKVFRGRYSAALGKMRSRQEQEEELGGLTVGLEVTSVAPPVFRPSKAPKRTYVTSTEL